MNFNYHSIGVYRWNEYMIKLRLTPLNIHTSHNSASELPIEEYIKKHGSYHAEMSVQFCYDDTKHPINKLNQEWKDSPSISIGKLTLNEVLDKTCKKYENLSFNPFENIENYNQLEKYKCLEKRLMKPHYLQEILQINKKK